MKKSEWPSNHERWLVSYADFMTLLFAFFVVLYATSTQNQDKQKKFENTMKTELHLSGEGSGGSASQGGSGSAFQEINLFQQNGVGNGELADYVQRLLQKSVKREDRELSGIGLDGLRYDAQGVRISLNASTFFVSGSARLKKEALGVLNSIATILKQAPQNLMIEGHTDDQPMVSHEFESNWELASARAVAVVHHLIKEHGFDPQRLAAVSYGEQRPLVANNSDENRSKNRRIEILILNEQVKIK